MAQNNPAEAVPSQLPKPEKQADVSPATQQTETPEQQKERLEREKDLQHGEKQEKTEQELLALREIAGASAKSSSSEAAKTEVEEDLGTNKGAMDKISDGMQKMFAMVEKFMKQIQSMGSATLRGMAKTLGTLGFKPAEKWLLELADSDRSGLTDALKSQAGIALQKIDANDAAASALLADVDSAEQELAGQYARFGAVGVSRAAFYSQVVAEWVKQNPGKKNKKEGCTAADLREMATVAQKLAPPAAPQQVQAPAVSSGAEKPENFPTIDNLAVGTADLMKPTKINFNNQVMAVQALADGFMINGLRYRATHIQSNAVPTFTRVMRSANGITIKGSVGIFANEKELPLENAKELLTALSSGMGSYTKGDFRFDRV